MSVPPGPEPGQSLEDWVRESLLGPLPGDPASLTPESPPVVPAQRSAPPVLVPAQRSAPPTMLAASEREPAGEPQARVAEPPLATIPDGRRRIVLGAAVAAAAVLGIGLLTATPAASPGPVQRPAAIVDASAAPLPALTSAATTPVPALPAAVAVPFAGGRVDVGGGWRMGVTRPYLCPVLMTIPALASSDSRMVRMTVTIVNATGTAQQARAWTLQATADGSPVEMILWPSAGFRGVPDRVLSPGERVRFLVAVRLPARQVAVEVAAAHPSGVRAALTGRV